MFRLLCQMIFRLLGCVVFRLSRLAMFRFLRCGDRITVNKYIRCALVHFKDEYSRFEYILIRTESHTKPRSHEGRKNYFSKLLPIYTNPFFVPS